MRGTFALLILYAGCVAYSYVWLHGKYGRTHLILAMFWPLVAAALGVLRGLRAIVHHFTGDGKQLGR